MARRPVASGAASLVIQEHSGAHIRFDVHEDNNGYPVVKWAPATSSEELKIRSGLYGERMAQCTVLKGGSYVDPLKANFKPHYMWCYGIFFYRTPKNYSDTLWFPDHLSFDLRSFFVRTMRSYRKVLIHDDLVDHQSGEIVRIPDRVMDRLENTGMMWMHSLVSSSPGVTTATSIHSWATVVSSALLALTRLDWSVSGAYTEFIARGRMDAGMLEYLMDWLERD